jgi:isoleucyl-tRNA synthetase
MEIAQAVTSMVLGLRRKVNIKVRQPLNKIMIPILNKGFEKRLDAVKDLILNEVNVKEVEYLHETEGILVKKIKPDFKALGPRYGKLMKGISAAINRMDQHQIAEFENSGTHTIEVEGEVITLSLQDVEIASEDIPGWLVTSEGNITVALDVTITPELRYEGIARELINRIQNIRKESDFDVTDKVSIMIEKHDAIVDAIEKFGKYIGSQTLAEEIQLQDRLENGNSRKIAIDDDITVKISVSRIR